jgi:DNA-directed RNA polymerase specialized sigma24 family protein
MRVCVPCDWQNGATDVDNLWPLTVQPRPFLVAKGPLLAATMAGGMDTAFIRDDDGKRLVDACVAGDAAARRCFVGEFMPLIYRFEGGGSQHESVSQNFIAFLFDDDRLYRRLRSYRGVAHLGPYLWKRILPDLMKQFRKILRRRRLDTVSLDADNAPPAVAEGSEPVGAAPTAPVNVTLLVEQLPVEKRLLLKLLYIEDFDLDPAEIQQLAERTGRSIRDVIARLETARQTVRSREAVQHARLEGAASAGQWIRLYERRLAQLEEDIAAAPDSPRAARLRSQREELSRKLDKRKRQQAEYLRSSSNTVVTLPTAMVADLLGQVESTTRAQITRVRQELAESLPKASRPRAENP